MPKGTVAKWLNHKGLGFITPAGETEGENDLLVHHTEIKQSGDGFKTLKVGSSVEFTVGTDSKNPEKKVATGVTGVDGADCEPKGKGKQADGADKKGKGKKVDAVPEEKRIDVEDGLAYTWDEISAHYNRKYKKKEIAAYWEDMKPAKRGRKGKKEAEQPATGKKGKKDEKPDKKGKAKQEPKAKEKKPAGNFKVTVCGGSGGIGQPLSLLMATDPNCGELNIFDLNIAMVAPAGVAADLGHLEKKAKVTGYVMEVGKKPIDHLEECLTGCHLVLVPAGVPRKPGQSRDDLFKINADIAKGIVEACAKYCPDAVLGMIVNPVNSVVPAMAELYKKKGLDPMKIVGITTLDCVRANKFVGEMTGKNPAYINVPVIGGHAGTTILPLFSQDKVAKTIDADKIPDLDKRVQNAGTVVVDAKNGKGSATLSMAYAGARLGKAILQGLSGRRAIECAYVKSDVQEGFEYFTSKCVFGENGVKKVLDLGELNDYEKTRLKEACEQLKGEIATGVKYAEANELA